MLEVGRLDVIHEKTPQPAVDKHPVLDPAQTTGRGRPRRGQPTGIVARIRLREQPKLRKLPEQTTRLPRSRALPGAGNSNAANNMMIAMTTRSSIKVNAASASLPPLGEPGSCAWFGQPLHFVKGVPQDRQTAGKPRVGTQLRRLAPGVGEEV